MTGLTRLMEGRQEERREVQNKENKKPTEKNEAGPQHAYDTNTLSVLFCILVHGLFVAKLFSSSLGKS